MSDKIKKVVENVSDKDLDIMLTEIYKRKRANIGGGHGSSGVTKKS